MSDSVATAIVVATGAVILYALIEANAIAVRRITLDFTTLPKAFDGYRIVFASDFHVRFLGIRERTCIRKLGELSGDLLVLGGDYQRHRRSSVRGGIAFVEEIAGLTGRYPDGIVAVRGNHDRRGMREYLKAHSAIRFLSASHWLLNRGGAKIGIAAARKKPGKKGVRARAEARRMAVAFGPDVRFRILIAHWPDYFPAAKRHRFDLVLSGDTHGGQIRLPFLGPIVTKTELPRRYAYGLHREGRTTLYTTSGIGTRSFPFRLFCRPEIVIFELRRNPERDESEDPERRVENHLRKQVLPRRPVSPGHRRIVSKASGALPLPRASASR